MLHNKEKILRFILLLVLVTIPQYVPYIILAQQTPNFRNPTEGTATSGFGWRNHPRTGEVEFHKRGQRGSGLAIIHSI
jgi:murein DD-endopeptidase MepM/ murein hydrolase activator NlpD